MLIVALLLAQEPTFTHEDWASWQGFAEGSSITMDTPYGKLTHTLARKTATTVTIRRTEEGGKPAPLPENTYTKPAPDTKRYIDGTCPSCGKHKPGKAFYERDRLKVGDRELDCVVEVIQWASCDGKPSRDITRAWYSKVVPGWTVATMSNGTTNSLAVAFDARPLPAGHQEAPTFDALRAKRRACDDPDLVRLAQAGSASVKHIGNLLKESSLDIDHRSNLFHLLGHIAGDEALGIVKNALDGVSVNDRYDAMDAIGHFQRADVHDYLIARLKGRDLDNEGLYKALVRSHAKKAVEPLHKLTEAPETLGWAYAADALAELGDAKSGERLAVLIPRIKGHETKFHVARAALRLGVKRMEAEIRSLQTSPADFVRYEAAAFILGTGDLTSLDPLIADLRNPKLKVEAWFVCEAIRAHIPELPPAGKEGPSSTLTAKEREAVATWLASNRAKLVFDPLKKKYKLR